MLDIEWYKTKYGYAVEVSPLPQAEYRVTEIEKFVKQSKEKELQSSRPLLRSSCFSCTSFLTYLVSFRLYFYFTIIIIFDSCFSICDNDHEEGDIEAGIKLRSDGVTKSVSYRED